MRLWSSKYATSSVIVDAEMLGAKTLWLDASAASWATMSNNHELKSQLYSFA
jgi:hypothetical protein